MNVLSLFDGISCAYVALQRAGFQVHKYYASEIDKHAITVSKTNVPCRIDIGDVREITSLDDTIDLLVGGSPCQDLSIAKKGRQGLAGNRSSLFYEYVRIKELVKPKWFILENVASMPKADRDEITRVMGVEPIMINASLVSAQSRKRLFWTNIPDVRQPEDRGILLKDILEEEGICGRDIGRRLNEEGHREDNNTDIPISRRIETREDGKSGTLTSVMKDNVIVSETRIRKLTPIECERLQGLPDNYTQGIAMTNRYKALGNAFNVEVVAHILKSIPKE